MNVPAVFRRAVVEERQQSLSLDDYIGLLQTFNFHGLTYTLPNSSQEEIGGDYLSLVRSSYKGNGVIFACMLVRMLLFSEARFQFRQRRSGRPGALFGTADLDRLETPWVGGTTGDMLSRMIQYADLAGNAYVVRRPLGLQVLRPDWMAIIIGSRNDRPQADDPKDRVLAWDIDSEVVGYAYQPGGAAGGRDKVFFLADEVAHFAPIPDPEAQFRGMSWLSPIVREVMADKAATQHKLKFFENGATPNMVVKLDVSDIDKFRRWVEDFRGQHEGAVNAYKTLFLGAGADATVVGKDFQQIEFKATQGAGETRIAAAAGVPPVIVGLSEGLQAATYSNYGQARRRFADGTMRPLWRNVAGSLARIVNVPSGAELWYDDRDIPFLAEDQKDAAEIQGRQAETIRRLVDGGFTPASVISAVVAGDFSQLAHTGLLSVQLQEPGTSAPPAAPSANGAASQAEAADIVARILEPQEG